MTNSYETIFIVNPNLSEEDTKSIVAKFTSLIESAGTIESVEDWGKRKLAYEINDEKEGYYTLVNFTADSQFPRELERNYKITDSILRYLVVKKEK